MKKGLYIAFFFSLLQISCSEDYFKRELEIDLPKQDTLLNIFSLINVDATGLFARVSHTRNVGERGGFSIIDDAELYLYENDELVGSLVHDAEGVYNLNTIVDFTNTESRYTLEVLHPTLPNAMATVVHPDKVPINDVLIETDRLSPDGDYITTLKFDDPPGESFYNLRAVALKDGDIREVNLYSDFEALFTESFFGLVFDDETFNEQDVSLLINTPNFLVDDNWTIIFQLLSLNQGLHDYLLTADFAFENDDNPFAEPIFIPSNFDNAVGALGIYVQQSYTARVE